MLYSYKRFIGIRQWFSHDQAQIRIRCEREHDFVAFTRPRFSGMGYSGKEGMHIFRTPVTRALEDRGPLPSNVTKTSWKGPKHQQVNFVAAFWFLRVLMCCFNPFDKSWQVMSHEGKPRTGLGILSLIQPVLVWPYTVHYQRRTGTARLNPSESSGNFLWKVRRKSIEKVHLFVFFWLSRWNSPCFYDVTIMMWGSNIATASSKSCLDHFCFSGGHGNAEDLRWGLSWSTDVKHCLGCLVRWFFVPAFVSQD